MMLEVKVEQDPVVFHVVIFENSIWRRATNSVDELKTLFGKTQILVLRVQTVLPTLDG